MTTDKSSRKSSRDSTADLQAACTHPPSSTIAIGHPHVQPIHLSVVWECEDPAAADQLLANPGSGYVYRRDGHPNATSLAQQLAVLHQTDRAALTAQGMSALALAFLSQLNPGDHVVLARQLYGKTLRLVGHELKRWGVTSSQVDINDLTAIQQACQHDRFRILAVETIANPCLEIADISALASIAHNNNGLLLVDNTFATPILCQPIKHGADLVMESLSKFVCGHGDAMLGLLCGKAEHWTNVDALSSTWGLASSPLDCWLTQRGVATLPIRLQQACENASKLATFLAGHDKIASVYYPGLPTHPQHTLAKRLFDDRFGHMLSFRTSGGAENATNLMQHLKSVVPFCPSLGECQTTFSHPASTSHRGLSAEEKKRLGIDDSLLRLSCGIEPATWLIDHFQAALAKL